MKSKNKYNPYWMSNIKYVSILLLFWFIISFGAGIIYKDFLDEIFTNFKLGFWFAQQGSIYGFVLLIFIYVRLMNNLDKKYGFKK